MFAIARTTALATTWATVSVNADGRENCARIRVLRVFRLLLVYNDDDVLKLFFFLPGFYGKKCRQPCPSCVNGNRHISLLNFSTLNFI